MDRLVLWEVGTGARVIHNWGAGRGLKGLTTTDRQADTSSD